MKFKRTPKKLMVGMLVMVLIGLALVPEALAYETGRLCYGDNVDVWGIDGSGDEDRNTTSFIDGYMYHRIKIEVTPDWPLDVAVGLFVRVPGGKPRLLKAVDSRGRGGKEYLSYYVSPSNFSTAELLTGYWLIGVVRASGCDSYKIEADVY